MGAPSGTVTFLFTDIEGSTALWETAPEAMRAALARHDEIARGAIEAHGGYVFATGGDGFGAAFSRAGDALAAATDAQSTLGAEAWPDAVHIRVRMALHTGEATERDGDYFGPTVNRAARLMAIAHGGQTLCSAATATLAEDVPFQDLGDHRLRDLTAPQRVFQIGENPFPPLRSLDAYPTNLPAQLSSFIGREGDLAEVATALDNARVVTLTGVGGVGKTRLALQAAADVLPHFRDGVWLVELGPLGDPDRVVDVVAAALRLTEPQARSVADSVVDYLRAKEGLLVLDNCEHLLDAVASFLTATLTNCPRVSVLVTSREGLGVAGEQLVVVSPLGLPGKNEGGAELAKAEAVRLFVERAHAANPAFVLDDRNAAPIAQLVGRLDGIPLAIELAAGRVRSLSPAEIAERIDDRFRLLASGRRTAVERHQTLRRAIDWSYGLLSQPERVALQRAAVFAGGFSLSSAEDVLAGDPIERVEVIDLLDRLIDKSLMVAEDHDGTTRYRLLETIRQYAEEHLEATGEAGAVRDRHAEHYAVFAAAAGDGLRGPEEIAWADRFDRELQNLRSSLAWTTSTDNTDLAVSLVAPVAAIGTHGGYAFLEWVSSIIAMPAVSAHPTYPVLLAFSGYARVPRGDLDDAAGACREAIAAAESISGNTAQLCDVLLMSAVVAGYRGAFNEVQALFARLEQLAHPIGALRTLAVGYILVATALSYTGREQQAIDASRQAVRLARQTGNPTTIANATAAAANAIFSSDPDGSYRLFDEAFQLAAAVGNRTAMGTARFIQAGILLTRGDLERAASLAAEGLGHHRYVGNSYYLTGGAANMAVILEAARDDRAATILIGQELPDRGYHNVHGWSDRRAEAISRLRGRLGDDRFDELAAQGRAMDIDALTSIAIEHLEAVAGPPT